MTHNNQLKTIFRRNGSNIYKIDPPDDFTSGVRCPLNPKVPKGNDGIALKIPTVLKLKEDSWLTLLKH